MQCKPYPKLVYLISRLFYHIKIHRFSFLSMLRRVVPQPWQNIMYYLAVHLFFLDMVSLPLYTFLLQRRGTLQLLLTSNRRWLLHQPCSKGFQMVAWINWNIRLRWTTFPLAFCNFHTFVRMAWAIKLSWTNPHINTPGATIDLWTWQQMFNKFTTTNCQLLDLKHCNLFKSYRNIHLWVLNIEQACLPNLLWEIWILLLLFCVQQLPRLENVFLATIISWWVL